MHWQFRDPGPTHAPLQWAEELSITPLLLELLWRRGFRDLESLDAFLSARLKDVSHPATWPHIPEAANMLANDLLAGKKLAIWGDYDTDGITSVALVLEVLEHHGFAPDWHLPDRRQEGYGLNLEGIERLANDGCRILLTVDCGIADLPAVARARELGMRVIITDHHLPCGVLPEADAIIDPRMPGKWPCVHLAGVGVAFFLMAAVNLELAKTTGRKFGMENALDLVSLGTLADIMQLSGDNRILTRAGLSRMEKTRRIGLAALKQVAGMGAAAAVSTDQALFRLVPRINAAGRMGSPDLALDLLRAKEFGTAERLAASLDAQNQARKTEEKRVFAEAMEQARNLLEEKPRSALVLAGEDWHPGIVGIVAARIAEHFDCPAFVLCHDGEILKGSGRSVCGFDLNAALHKTSGCLLGFGGHSQAAGARLQKADLEKFRRDFHEVVLQERGANPQPRRLELEGVLDFAKAGNQEFLQELELMQPFGPGNEEPVFASPPVKVLRRSFLGHSGEHIKLQVRDEERGVSMEAKGWRMVDKLPSAMAGRHVRLAYVPRLDSYNGLSRVTLEIKDWRWAE